MDSARWLADFASNCGASWPTMTKALTDASSKRTELARSVSDAGLPPADTAVIVFGSLARGEWTFGSDLDWSLFVDGQVDSSHTDVARSLANMFATSAKKPGPTGVFGGLAFSHDLVHFIGGDDDSNTNTTRRILLLIESKSLGEDDSVRSRVIEALLSRYVGEDLLYHEPKRFMVPRFLLNDYVRYWRTMAVDSAQKRRDRVEKWALRNIKLRLSRKLIFVTGLWGCLSCKLHPSSELATARASNDRDGVSEAMTAQLLGCSQRSPLENLASAFTIYEKWDAAKECFDAYEEFLSILDDQTAREGLEALEVDRALADPIFSKAKAAASDFQSGLATLFFRTDDDLTKAAQADGVF